METSAHAMTDVLAPTVQADGVAASSERACGAGNEPELRGRE
jgi:hypothetical protein